MFSCQFCEKVYNRKDNLYKHQRAKHGHEPVVYVRKYKCGVCGTNFTHSHSLIRHIRDVHKCSNYIKCSYCPTIFAYSNNLKEHCTKIHNITDVVENNQTTIFIEIESSQRRFLRVYEYQPEGNEFDVDGCLIRAEPQVSNLVSNIQNEEENPFKIQLSVRVRLIKELHEETIESHFNSLFEPIYTDGLQEEVYEKMKDHIMALVDNFTQQGSGWIVENIKSVRVNFAKLYPIRGGCYIPTPEIFKDNRFLLNIKTRTAQNCLELCLLAALHREEIPAKDRQKSESYQQFQGNVEMCGVENPVKLRDIGKLEKTNGMSINIFTLDEDDTRCYPLRISKFQGLAVDLLLLANDTLYHYCLITNFNAFMGKINEMYDARYIYCRRCLHGCRTRQSYNNHKVLCNRNEPCRIDMPSEDNNEMTWKKFSARAMVPFCVYADLEAITVKVQGCQSNSMNAYTQAIEQHIPCGAAAVLVDYNQKIVDRFLHRGSDCVDQMMVQFRKWAHFSYNQKRKFPTYIRQPGDAELLKRTTVCWLCEKPMMDEKDKVYEHDHVTGRLRGIAHKDCNSACKTLRYLPVFFHNGAGYDFKHILKQYKAGSIDEKINCIPTNEECYISFSVSVPVNRYKDKKTGQFVPVYEVLKFLDTFKFLSKSLEKLVVTLKKDNIPLSLTQAGFAQYSDGQIELLSKKGVYPYSYMDSFDKFQECSLPSKWIDSITGACVSDTDYDHAQTVWCEFNIANLGEYHDLYLQTDVLLLADVFENFRRLCMRIYGLDPAQYLTAPNLAWDAMLKTTHITLKLMQDKDQLDFVKSCIRGGMCGTYHCRHWRANNPHCPDYDPSKPTSWLLLLDANNLYGGVMMEPLPSGELEWDEDVSVDEVLATPDDACFGYFVMVDLQYPSALHDKHSDFPLAPEHAKIKYDDLSDFQKQLLLPKKRLQPVKKLLQTLYDKKQYVCHYRILKLYVQHGLVITKMHRVLRFRQSKWMAEYIDLNTELRKSATTECQKDFAKLANNSVFGKSMEDLLNRVTLLLVSDDEDKLKKITAKPNFKRFTAFQEHLSAITLGKTKITWNKPTFVGATVLELSKLVMYEFYYNVMKPRYDSQVHLLYSDTDSLLVAVETENVYKDMLQFRDHFDFSDYPSDSELFNKVNHLKVLKMKDELKSYPMLEYVGLRPKMYSLKYLKRDAKTNQYLEETKQSNKGVTATVKQGLHHEQYLSVLQNQETVRKSMTIIRSHQLQIVTERVNKIVLSSMDDKRYLIETNQSLPFGHYSIERNDDEDEEDCEVEGEFDANSIATDEEEYLSTPTATNFSKTPLGILSKLLPLANDSDVPDPGFWRTAQISEEDDDEDIYIPPKKRARCVFILDEALEEQDGCSYR